MAIGNPFGLGGSVTAGIISARSRNINAGPYDDFIQTDASINRGNSGGPLFNMDGEVIGVNTAIFSPSGGSVGIGFAIAVNLAKPVIQQLREFGKTRRGWLGVRIQPVTDEIAESLALDEPRGALVASVFDPGPAAVAGFEAGDVILKFDGKDVPRVRVLPRIVAETEIGKAVDVEVWRKGGKITLSVKIGELKEDEVAALTSGESGGGASGSIEALGMTLSSITGDLRDRFEIGGTSKGSSSPRSTTNLPQPKRGFRLATSSWKLPRRRSLHPARSSRRSRRPRTRIANRYCCWYSGPMTCGSWPCAWKRPRLENEPEAGSE